MLDLAHTKFGLDKSTIDRLQIGYAPGNSLGQGINREIDGRTGLLMDLGLYQEHGFGQPRSEAMAQRLTFPVLDRAGSIVGIHGRATRPGQGPSFVSLAEDAARRMPMMSGTGKQKAILVETTLDHAALVQWDFDSFHSCIAMLGASPDRVLAHLVATGVKHAVIAGEQSASGMARALEIVLAMRAQNIMTAARCSRLACRG
jgi:DNA primase